MSEENKEKFYCPKCQQEFTGDNCPKCGTAGNIRYIGEDVTFTNCVFTSFAEKNRHNLGNSPQFHGNCIIVDENAPDIEDCPFCQARDDRTTDEILSADFLQDNQ